MLFVESCVSGNNALTPKPYIAPDSSSDEGLAGCTADFFSFFFQQVHILL